jgi:hypothetical protein
MFNLRTAAQQELPENSSAKSQAADWAGVEGKYATMIPY